MITKPGVVISQIEELDRVKFEPLGTTKPPLPRIYVHDYDGCVYLGSLEVERKHHDFYKCPEQLGMVSYIARYGSAGQEYVSLPDVALRQIGTHPDSVEDVLRTLCVFYDCKIRSDTHGFAVLQNEMDPIRIDILIHPLIEERRQIYIQDAVQKGWGVFSFEAITPETLHRLRGSISALVEQQIMEGR